MKLYLENKFETILDINPSDFRDRLSTYVERPTVLRRIIRKKHKLFYGEVADETFKILRITGQRNGSMPNLEGQFKAHDCGTKISIIMKPDPEIFTFVIAWTIGNLGLALCAAGYYRSMQLTTAGSLLLFCIGIILIYQYFWSEVPKSKEKFIGIFTG